MSVYIIGYDLNKPDKDYPDLINAIKELSGTWWHNLDSTWLVVHDGDAGHIRNTLTPHIDSDDELLVSRLSGEAAWAGFSDSARKWLRDNLGK